MLLNNIMSLNCRLLSQIGNVQQAKKENSGEMELLSVMSLCS